VQEHNNSQRITDDTAFCDGHDRWQVTINKEEEKPAQAQIHLRVPIREAYGDTFGQGFKSVLLMPALLLALLLLTTLYFSLLLPVCQALNNDDSGLLLWWGTHYKLIPPQQYRRHSPTDIYAHDHDKGTPAQKILQYSGNE
jgi:hypothetical protein